MNILKKVARWLNPAPYDEVELLESELFNTRKSLEAHRDTSTDVQVKLSITKAQTENLAKKLGDAAVALVDVRAKKAQLERALKLSRTYVQDVLDDAVRDASRAKTQKAKTETAVVVEAIRADMETINHALGETPKVEAAQ